MPIQFSCPACGKQSLVDDQYAGQSGPCSGCGKTITIPFPAGISSQLPLASSGHYGPPLKSGGGGNSLVVILAVAVVGLLFCGGIMVALLLPAVQQAREAARRSNSSNNLRQIGIAIHTYHDTYQELPPAYVTDANGKPLYSGLVLLLPFLEQNNVFRQFKLDEAWDSPNNLALSSLVVKAFENPSSPSKAPGHGDYLLVGGPGSALDPALKKRSIAQITDGTSNTIMAIDTKTPSRSWAEPRIWDSTQPIDGPNSNVVQYLRCDASVGIFSKRNPPDAKTLRALETASGGEINTIPF